MLPRESIARYQLGARRPTLRLRPALLSGTLGDFSALLFCELARASVSALEATEPPERNGSGILLPLDRLPGADLHDARRYQVYIRA
jgi:hypothetical protein